MKHTMLLVSLFIASASAIAGDSPSAVGEIAMKDCNLNMIKDVEYFRNVKRQSELASQKIPLLEQMKTLASIATKPGVPVGDQLSRSDNAKFAEIRQKMMAIGALSVIESNRMRDVETVFNLAQLADRNYRWNTDVQDGSPDYVYQAGLLIMRAALPATKITKPHVDNVCSLELALQFLENEPLTKLDAIDTKKGSDILTALAASYKVNKIDRSKLSDADKNSFDSVMREIANPANKELHFINDVEHIKSVAKALDLIYETGRIDLADGGGDFSNVGTSIRNQARKNGLSDEMATAITVLRKIGDQVPSEAIKQAIDAAKMIDEVNKKYPTESTK